MNNLELVKHYLSFTKGNIDYYNTIMLLLSLSNVEKQEALEFLKNLPDSNINKQVIFQFVKLYKMYNWKDIRPIDIDFSPSLNKAFKIEGVIVDYTDGEIAQSSFSYVVKRLSVLISENNYTDDVVRLLLIKHLSYLHKDDALLLYALVTNSLGEYHGFFENFNRLGIC